PLSSHPHHPPPLHTSPLSLHDALPISPDAHVIGEVGERRALRARLAAPQSQRRVGQEQLANRRRREVHRWRRDARMRGLVEASPDRKSTRLNSSHVAISYAVFCLKKKK